MRDDANSRGAYDPIPSLAGIVLELNAMEE
jgi:hypothetical protein